MWLLLGTNFDVTWVGKIWLVKTNWEGKTEKFHQRVIPPSTPLKGNVSDETNNYLISKKQITRSRNSWFVDTSLKPNQISFCKTLLQVQIRKSFSERNSHLIFHSTTRALFFGKPKVKNNKVDITAIMVATCEHLSQRRSTCFTPGKVSAPSEIRPSSKSKVA